MACHKDQADTAHPLRLCAGWLAVVGPDHIGVRIAMLTGRLLAEAVYPPDEERGCAVPAEPSTRSQVPVGRPVMVTGGAVRHRSSSDLCSCRVGETKQQLAVRMREADPKISAEKVAAVLGVSSRTVHRYWAASRQFTHRGRVLTDADRESIAASHQQGASVKQLADQFGVHRDTVRAALAASGITLDGSTAPKGIDPQKVVDLYTQGMSRKAIAAHLKIGGQTVSYYLDQAGVPRRSRRRSYPDTRRKVVALMTATPGIGRKTIAEELGITMDTVAYHIRRARQLGELPAAGSQPQPPSAGSDRSAEASS
ncbi:hypothetical protein ACSNOI_40825 [Actinomadura kijaniata]|uniref:hypothetical protein n=1 Tax=Actinomadura kijaniata TaxID=46161 RepID=UPI003F1B190C